MPDVFTHAFKQTLRIVQGSAEVESKRQVILAHHVKTKRIPHFKRRNSPGIDGFPHAGNDSFHKTSQPTLARLCTVWDLPPLGTRFSSLSCACQLLHAYSHSSTGALSLRPGCPPAECFHSGNPFASFPGATFSAF